MKSEWIFLGLLITFFVVLIFWNLINPIKKESFKNNDEDKDPTVDADTEFHHVDQNTMNQLGNYLTCYFYNMGVSFLHGKNFQTKVKKNGDMFTNYFPEKIQFDKKIQESFISAGITDETLKTELDKIDGHCMSAWTVVSKEIDIFWSILKPKINEIIKNALEKSELNVTIDAPVIHYRCSDMPFGKYEYYHFQKYSFFKDSLDRIQKQLSTKYNKVYICYCNSHRAEKENQESCDKYMKSLIEYLESLGYEVITKCKSVNEDFAMMFYAPGLISTSSSFSFMAGYFSDGVFISSMYDERTNRECEECDWYKKGYTLKHSEVDDYHNTDKVISMLKG